MTANMGLESHFPFMRATVIALLLLASFTCGHNVPQSGETSLIRRFTPGIECRYTGVARDDETCAIFADRYRIGVNALIAWNSDQLSKTSCVVVSGKEYCVASDGIPVSSDGRCGSGSSTTTKCESSTFGECCSATGYCGNTTDHCGIGNCQSGSCVGDGLYTYDGLCGPKNGKLCGGTWGICCSSIGYCGTTEDHCGTGCYSGDCTVSSTSSRAASSTTFKSSSTSSPTPSPTVPSNVTADGQCSTNGKICTGSTFGKCCSSAGYCGDTSAHCGTGCNPKFGTCDTPTNVSPDGTCGGTNKYTCTNGTFGTCCSSAGYCGSTASHCGQACQSSFGTCATTNVASNTGECGANRGKYTCAGGPFDGMCCSANGYCGSTTDHCTTGW